MNRIITVLAFVVCILATATADEPNGQFQGQWHTTTGPLKRKQNRDIVSSTDEAGGQFSLKGIVKGKILTFEYTEDQTKGDGRFAFDAVGNAFTGRFQIRNGRNGYWNGWWA